MMTNMQRAINDKKQQIFKIKQGAVISTEPKVIWVKILDQMKTYEKMLTVRSK